MNAMLSHRLRTPATAVFFVLAICTHLPISAQSRTSATVPFIGCKSDGQVGPLAAPTGQPKAVMIAPGLAAHLAYYQAENGPGVLAPLGWHCFGVYGSNGSSLFVTPQALTPELVFSDNWNGFSGPAIQLSVSLGGTSGRFEVAKIIARIFPAYRSFVTHVIAEKLEQPSSFPFGPYPKDHLTYQGKKIVEYQTPPNTDGLGTDSRLQKNSDPITGVAILEGADTNLIHLSARLPPDLAPAATSILHQVERDTAILDRQDR